MSLSRLVIIAAAAAGAVYYVKGRGGQGALSPVPGMPRTRLSLAGGMGAAMPASSPVAETMWTPSAPGDVSGATAGSLPPTGSPA